MKQKLVTKQLIIMALLIGLEVILTRFFAINTPIIRIGFGFLPMAILAIMYGPIWGALSYGVADILGAVLFPSGPFFPGFTLSAVLTGLIYGFLFYKKELSWKRVIIAALVETVFISLLLNTFWLSILMGQGYLAILPARIIKAAISLPLQVILIKFTWTQLDKRIALLQSN